MSNSDQVMVKPIKPFEDDKKGWQEPGGEAYAVSRARASELKANGLVEDAQGEADGDQKAAEAHENKMAAAPSNKSAEPPAKKQS